MVGGAFSDLDLADGLGVDRALPGEFVGERFQFVAARHQAGQVGQVDLVAVRVEDHLAEFEHHEVVADQVCMVRVVGDEHHAKAGIPGSGGVFEYDAGLLDPQRRGGLVQDQYPRAEIHRAGDRHALPLTTGQGADRLVDVLEVDAHLGQLILGGGAHVPDGELVHRPVALAFLRAEEEVAPHFHQRHHGQVLIDGGDPHRQRIPR